MILFGVYSNENCVSQLQKCFYNMISLERNCVTAQIIKIMFQRFAELQN